MRQWLVLSSSVLFMLALQACAGSKCEEWVSREVVDFNFCDGSMPAEVAARSQAPLTGQCVARGTRERLYCVERPGVDGQPVNH